MVMHVQKRYNSTRLCLIQGEEKREKLSIYQRAGLPIYTRGILCSEIAKERKREKKEKNRWRTGPKTYEYSVCYNPANAASQHRLSIEQLL
jgi:hypothetical protein